MQRVKITIEDADTGEILETVIVNKEDMIPRPRNFWEFMAFLCTYKVPG